MPYRRYIRTDPRRYYTLAIHKLGRRGFILFLGGLIWIGQGLGTITAPANTRYYLLDNFEIMRAALWIVTGVVAILYSRKPQGHDTLGFMSLYFMAAFLIIAYGTGFVAWLVPGGLGGEPRGIVGIFSWGLILTFLTVTAGWREPDEEVLDDRSRAR